MTGRYHTIVADPPWAYPEGWPTHMSAGAQMKPTSAAFVMDNRRTALPYASLSVADICRLPVSELAASAAHLYLWTTNRYLRDSFGVAEAWGFRPAQTLIWAKTPRGLGPGGVFAQNAEFCIFARRGALRSKQRCDTVWWNFKRQGAHTHSRKPDAFLDLVEQVSPGPYLELFARRQRLGWDTWGDEALEHVTLAAGVSGAD